jgi:hypothetical protein
MRFDRIEHHVLQKSASQALKRFLAFRFGELKKNHKCSWTSPEAVPFAE